MKASLKSIFIFGYILDKIGSVFLERIKMSDNKEVPSKEKTDLDRLRKRCHEIFKDGYSVNPLLFPEGTYIKASKLVIANEEQNRILKGNLPPLKYTLLPKIGGFKTLLLSQPINPEGICDMTLFVTPYTNDFPEKYPLKPLFLSGRNNVHINILVRYIQLPDSLKSTIIKIKKLNSSGMTSPNNLDMDSDKKCSDFLVSVFREKEFLLEKYAEKDPETSFKDFIENLDYSKSFGSMNHIKGGIMPNFGLLYFLPSLILYSLIAALILSKLSKLGISITALKGNFSACNYFFTENVCSRFALANPLVS
ncbi:hypothetical protein GINT2_000219 [Glugoides intestinalis]